MRIPRHSLILALTAVAVLSGFRAMSAPSEESDAREPDLQAARMAFTGEYYAETSEPDASVPEFKTFEEKRDYYLNNPNVDERETEFELEDDGSLVPQKPESAADEESDVASENEKSPSPESAPLQSYYFYNRGFLRNASALPPEGKGYTKIFRERDDVTKTGGRNWGARHLIAAIKSVAAQFADENPGRERLQIADMSKKAGGYLGHKSHQNGLEADIVYVRKKPREQPAVGGFGKNGFLEEFISSTVTGSRTYTTYSKKKKKKVTRVVKTYRTRPTSNFDVEANVKLLKLFMKATQVEKIFMDNALIHAVVEYVKQNGLSDDPETRALIMKLDPLDSHADHFHLRIACQSTDKLCVSDISRGRSAHHSSSKKGAHKTASKPAKTAAKSTGKKPNR